MHPDIGLVIQLQAFDQKITALEKEIASLPKQLAALEKTLESHVRKLEADQAAQAANQKERKKLDGDIQMHQQKISKLRDQMLGAKTNEQYRAFQNEIDYIEKEIRAAEDRTLELMTESEPLDVAVKRAQTVLNEEKRQVDAEKTRTRERTAQDQAEMDQVRAQRAEAAAKIPPATLNLYNRIRKKWRGGAAVAEVVNGRCNACQIVLRPQHVQDLRRGDHVMQCESCGRFLFYNPPVNLEDAAAVR
jgi:hypothetical protein